MSLDRLLRGEVAVWVLRCVSRDLAERPVVPTYGTDVFKALQRAAARRNTATLASETSAASLGMWGSARDAADLTGRSVQWIRELARTGQVRALRIGARTWQIDLDSAANVCGRKERRDGRGDSGGRRRDVGRAGSGGG